MILDDGYLDSQTPLSLLLIFLHLSPCELRLELFPEAPMSVSQVLQSSQDPFGV
jgi:hypothetical protein